MPNDDTPTRAQAREMLEDLWRNPPLHTTPCELCGVMIAWDDTPNPRCMPSCPTRADAPNKSGPDHKIVSISNGDELELVIGGFSIFGRVENTNISITWSNEAEADHVSINMSVLRRGGGTAPQFGTGGNT